MKELTKEEIRSINDKIKQEYTAKHVLQCMTSIVGSMLNAGDNGNTDFPSWDEVENNYIYNVDLSDSYESYSYDQLEEKREGLLDELQELTSIEYDADAIKRDAELDWFIEEVEQVIEELGNWFLEEEEDRIAFPEEWLKFSPDKTERSFVSIQVKAETLIQDLNTVRDAESEPADIMEWWLVDSSMYQHLQEQGEAVLCVDNFNYFWGRQASGQSIYIDGVIHEILDSMRALHGQENDWSKFI